jgi:hypothetical protein
MAAANGDVADNGSGLKDRKEMFSATEASPRAADGETGSHEDYHIDPVKESKMMRKFDVRVASLCLNVLH